MDFNFEGIDLPDEQKEALQAQAKQLSETMVSKQEFEALAAKNDELLTETKKAKEAKRLEVEAKEQAKQDAAIKNGDVESLQKALQEQQERYNNLEGSIAQEKEQGSISKFIEAVLSEHVTSDKAARMYIENELKGKVGYKDGQVMPVNDEGALTGATLNELVNAVVSDPSNKPYMLASNASGGGAAGGNNTGGGAVGVPKSLAECKGDAEKERQYFQNQRTQMQG